MTTDRLLPSSPNPLALSLRPFPPPAESDRSGREASSGSGSPAVYDRRSSRDLTTEQRISTATARQTGIDAQSAGVQHESLFFRRSDAVIDPLLSTWYRTVLSLHGVLDRTGRIVDLLA